MHSISFSPPDISDAEIEEIVKTLKSGWITTGPRTKLFENNIAKYCNVLNCACFNSATAALEMALRLFELGPEDEVIVPAYTHTSTAAVVLHVGAKLVMVDTAKDQYEIDCEKLRDAITEHTKVVIPVDIGGLCCNYDKLFEVLESKKNLYTPSSKVQKLFDRPIMLADAAHSFGASYHGLKSGNLADFTAFSFHAVKNLTTAEGGAVVWKEREGLDSEKIYRDFHVLSLHGQSRDAYEKAQASSWEYDVVNPGYKCNMTDIMAAFGLKQLERFDTLLERRKEINDIYDSILLPHGIDRLDHKSADRQGNYHLYLTRTLNITMEQRNEVILAMAGKGIACNVHFKPLPLLSAYKNMGFNIDDFKNAKSQYQNEITLPLHTLLSNEEAAYVANSFIECLKDNGLV